MAKLVREYMSSNEVDYFNRVPKVIVTDIFTRTTPVDVCRLSAVTKKFKQISDLDTVWEKFLPNDYRNIITQAVPEYRFTLLVILLVCSKKKLYLHMCDHPTVTQCCNQSFWLHKSSGKICFNIPARKLAWNDKIRFWKWSPHPQLRWTEVVEFISACSHQTTGTIKTNMLSPDTTYEAYLVLKQTPLVSRYEDQAVEMSIRMCIGIYEGETIKQTVLLNHGKGVGGALRKKNFSSVLRRTDTSCDDLANMVWSEHTYPREMDRQYPKEREDGWLEIKLGEYFIKGHWNGDLVINFKEMKGGNWLSGVIVQGMELRPKVKTDAWRHCSGDGGPINGCRITQRVPVPCFEGIDVCNQKIFFN